MLSCSSTGTVTYDGGLGGVMGGGGSTAGVGSAISVKVCLSSPPCRVAAACSRSQFPHYLSLSRSILISNKKAHKTHHVEHRAQVALVPHPPQSLSSKMRAHCLESAARPYLLTRVACNAWMRDFLVVVLHDRQRRGRMHGCSTRFLAQLAIYDERCRLVVFLFLLCVTLRLRRQRNIVRAPKFVHKRSKQGLNLFDTVAFMRPRLSNGVQLRTEESIEGGELIRACSCHWDGAEKETAWWSQVRSRTKGRA